MFLFDDPFRGVCNKYVAEERETTTTRSDRYHYIIESSRMSPQGRYNKVIARAHVVGLLYLRFQFPLVNSIKSENLI